jgi:hypothetical protein
LERLDNLLCFPEDDENYSKWQAELCRIPGQRHPGPGNRGRPDFATVTPKTWFALVKKYIYNMLNTKIKNEQYCKGFEGET